MIKRHELIDSLAKKGYTKKDAAVVISDVFRVLTELLASGEVIQVHGFGTFHVQQIAPRSTVDYRSQQRIVIPGHKAPKFIPGKLLKRAVREGFVRD